MFNKVLAKTINQICKKNQQILFNKLLFFEQLTANLKFTWISEQKLNV